MDRPNNAMSVEHTSRNSLVFSRSSLVGADVQLTMEIQAEVPDGIPEDRQRIVNENCRTLKFRNFGFEEE